MGDELFRGVKRDSITFWIISFEGRDALEIGIFYDAKNT